MKSSPQHGSKSSSFLPDGGCPQLGVGEAKERPRSEVEGPSSGGSGEPFRANAGAVEGTTASLPQSRDARVFLLTRWHCLHWGTRSEDPPNGAQAWASRLQRLSFVCVGLGVGGGVGDVHGADGHAINCPSSFWQKSHLGRGSSKEGEPEASTAPTKAPTVSILGTYLESGHSKEAFEH